MKKKHKIFDDWTAQEIRDTFDIQQITHHHLFAHWLDVAHTPLPHEVDFLEMKRSLLERFYRSWNEDELKFQFIAQVVELAHLRSDKFNTFSQRKLSATTNGIVLQGRPEVMIASGQEDPKKPFFFIHEYKPTRQSDDPLGQLLAAMLAAQTQNQDEKPLLGCFVIGAIWQFVILDNRTYALSRPYDALQKNDLQAIFSALCQAKVIINEMLNK